MAQDKGQKERIMKKLGISEEEALEMLAYDKEVDRTSGGLEYDLSKEAQKMAIKEAHKGQDRARKAPGTPTVYKFTQRQRKENVTKSDIISKLAAFLEEQVENVNIANKERQITFSVGDNNFELTLVQKRKKKE